MRPSEQVSCCPFRASDGFPRFLLLQSLEFPPGECCQELLLDSLQTRGKNDAEYLAAVQHGYDLGGRDGIDAVLRKYNLDALVVPSEAYINDRAHGLTCHPSAIAGYPLATVPLTTLATGQPTGLTFIGAQWSESKLIELM